MSNWAMCKLMSSRLFLLAALLWAGVTTGVCSAAAPAGPSAPDIKNVARHPLAEAVKSKKRAVVLFFVTADCPIANRFAPEINRICKDYEKRGVAFYIVQTDRTLTAKRAAEHAKEYGFTCPVLLDGKRELVKFCGASVTPQGVVLSPQGKTLYSGRIDDSYAKIGQFRVHPQRRDLRLALDEVLGGKAVSVARTKAIGCYIEG